MGSHAGGGDCVNIVDFVLIGAIIIFAWAGWRQGFIAGALSFAGFLGGGLISALWLPGFIEARVDSTFLRVVLVVLGVLVSAIAGQFLTSMLGRRLRGILTWKPIRVVDNVAGMGLNIIALAVVVWILASAIAYLPESNVSQQVRQSRVLVTLDLAVPDVARNTFGGLRDLVGDTAMPRVFSGFAEVIGPDVDDPDDQTLDLPVVEEVRPSVLRISGEACESQINGSGFVYAPEYVLTNAHVVAGIDRPFVQNRLADPPLRARVVVFDPELDIAVLYVPGLQAPPLRFAQEVGQSGSDALALGFPGGGGFRATPARIRTIVDARGDDIYGNAGVVREVYAFRGDVRPGNSGGPLVNIDGEVLGLVFAAGQTEAQTGFALTNTELANAARSGVEKRRGITTGSCELG
jgi:S1-C subfamily serine protease